MGRKKPAENTYKSNRIEIKFFFACYIFAHIICALTLKYALNCPNFCKSLFGTKKKKKWGRGTQVQSAGGMAVKWLRQCK